MYRAVMHIQGTKGKRAANAVEGKYGKGFPGDLVKRTRAMKDVSPDT